jgi:radical SAM-linked protein
VRTFERLFRRAEFKLSMSEGFHPKARMTFPSALSLGIRGLDEVMEVELAEVMDMDQLVLRLRQQAPAGLVIREARQLHSGESKAQVARFIYECPVPARQRQEVESKIAQLMAADHYPITREQRAQPIDLRATVEHLQLAGDVLTMRLAARSAGAARPREVLAALGLSDLESHGACLTRTCVELRS